MGFFFVYILKSGVCLSLFYLFYRLLLSKETFYRFNRIALLGILVFSLLLPLIEVTKAPQNEINQAVLTIEQLLVMAENHQETQVTTVVEGDDLVDTWRSPVHWIEIVLLFYIAGIFFLVCRNVYSLFRLVRLMNTAQRRQIDKHTVLLVHDRNVAPFSWMKFVVISRTDLEENGREILIHECAHIRKHHSWDLLIADICIFFQWFNPGAWLLKQELQNIHEYEADEAVINEGINARDYQLLLIKKAVGTRLYSMANSFNHSKLKKRITMMLKEKSNPWARLKYLYVLPLAAIAVTAFARPEISGKMDEISAVKVNDFVQIVGTKVPEKKVEVLKDTVKKDAPKEEAFEVSRLETVPTHSKVTITDGMKRSGMDLFSVRNAGSQPQPLIFVDGKEITGEQMQRDINPDMIESISVLKDEASTAIYGDKAKHGVILITLKGKDVQNVLSLSASDPEDGVKVVGVVKDHLDKPLAGASVFISGTVSGTMSDAYGRFVLLAPKNTMLRISYTGMTTVEKAVAPEVNVTLNPAD